MGKSTSKSDELKARSFKSIFDDVRKIFNLQLQTFTVQFVENITDEEMEAMLPEDIGDLDEWIEEYVEKFTENEEPTVDEMIEGSSAIFMMAFLEKLFDHLGIGADSKDDDDGDDGDD